MIQVTDPTRSDHTAVVSPAEVKRLPLDRRRLLRGAGTVLLSSAIAGCYHEGDGEGDGGDGGGEDDGGAYDIGPPPAPDE